MTKILFIIPYVPYPLDSGGNQAFYNMVDYLRQHMSVSVLLWPTSDSHLNDVKALMKRWDNVEFFIYQKQEVMPAVRHPRYYRLLGKIAASVKRKMRRQLIAQCTDGQQDLTRERTTLYQSLFSRLDEGYVNYVAEVAARGFDIIQVEFFELVSLGYLLPKDTETIFVHHELRYIRNEKEVSLFREAHTEDNMLLGISKDFERSALLQYKHVIALTEIDRTLLHEFLGDRVKLYASPAVVHIPAQSAETVSCAPTHRLTFVGTESHFPNMDALIWFCHEVVPELRRRGFSFTLDVAGKWYSAYTKKLRSLYPELNITGYVPDLANFFKGSIALVPIRIGSGMRMKILDAVFAHTPFVTTHKGVEGIDFRNGEECLMADEPGAFAEAIIRLAEDAELQTRLVRQAEQRLRQLYNPQSMLERRLNIYREILRNRH